MLPSASVLYAFESETRVAKVSQFLAWHVQCVASLACRLCMKCFVQPAVSVSSDETGNLQCDT